MGRERQKIFSANCKIHSVKFLRLATTFGIEDGRREAEYGTREAAVGIEPLEKGDQIYETILRRAQFEQK